MIIIKKQSGKRIMKRVMMIALAIVLSSTLLVGEAAACHKRSRGGLFSRFNGLFAGRSGGTGLGLPGAGGYPGFVGMSAPGLGNLPGLGDTARPGAGLTPSMPGIVLPSMPVVTFPAPPAVPSVPSFAS